MTNRHEDEPLTGRMSLRVSEKDRAHRLEWLKRKYNTEVDGEAIRALIREAVPA